MRKRGNRACRCRFRRILNNQQPNKSHNGKQVVKLMAKVLHPELSKALTFNFNTMRYASRLGLILSCISVVEVLGFAPFARIRLIPPNIKYIEGPSLQRLHSIPRGEDDPPTNANALEDAPVPGWILPAAAAFPLALVPVVSPDLLTSLPPPLGLLESPGSILPAVAAALQSQGPTGLLTYSLIYIACEVLCVPAIPLTASAGYIFGVPLGFLTSLLSGVAASGISFLIGRQYLRGYIYENYIEPNPRISAIDRVVSRDGFKIVLLLRLSPIFPFALSNYLYGAMDVAFEEYLLATAIGFAPGTFGYVYAADRAGALAGGGGGWVPAALTLGLLLAGIKVVSDVAAGVVEEMGE